MDFAAFWTGKAWYPAADEGPDEEAGAEGSLVAARLPWTGNAWSSTISGGGGGTKGFVVAADVISTGNSFSLGIPRGVGGAVGV